MTNFTLSEKERASADFFIAAAQLLSGEEDIKTYYTFSHVGGIGTSVDITCLVKGKDGKMTTFEKDITDHDSW